VLIHISYILLVLLLMSLPLTRRILLLASLLVWCPGARSDLTSIASINLELMIAEAEIYQKTDLQLEACRKLFEEHTWAS